MFYPVKNTEIRLMTRQGVIAVYLNKRAMLDDLGWYWIATELGTDFATRKPAVSWACRSLERPRYSYVAEDPTGRRLSLDDFADEREAKQQERLRTYDLAKATWNGKGPVPGVARRHGSYGSCYRKPKTMKTRRWAFDLDDEPKIRASQNARNQPNAWDDNPRSDLGNKNWKHYRKHQ